MLVYIGERIRNLRLASQLTQEELAARADLTKGFISQLERDRTSISLDSLAMILAALDTSLKEFFADESEKPVVFRRADRVSMAVDGCSEAEVLVPGATNRKMDPIVLHLLPGESVRCEPHEGEELGYVLSGVVSVRVGRRKLGAKTGDCYYLKANEVHSVENESTKEARVLWIATPPRL